MAKKYIDANKLKAHIQYLIKKDNYELFDVPELLSFIDSLQQETSGISLEEFTEKMEDWKARFNGSDDIPIKATMAFTARMFYMYPDIARQWYDSLPKAIPD